ncbi:hypothetical protein [Psychrobacter sp.]|uniref:hypothetical protein n=1 Tax=Psychrobacter sp. TaxID=56811 RepID=UPI002647790A|nr:hypothetical protein [Psychrobacter sp.]MDN6308069.1 hypothetical protein [Psychrobacter sp.]
MKRLSVLLVSSALVFSAQAANWSKVSESRSGSVVSIDFDDIESSDIRIIDEKDVENIIVSIRRSYPSRQANETVNEKSVHHRDQQLLISCKDLSYYTRANVDYTVNDEVINDWQSDKPILTSREFKITTPNTVGRTIVEESCNAYNQGKKEI